MKLLFDENLSPTLVDLLDREFPYSQHVETLEMRGATDLSIWQYAKKNNFVIVSKDNDFRQLAFLRGWPPKIIWLSVGNAGTRFIAALLTDRRERIYSFVQDSHESMLVLSSKLRGFRKDLPGV